MENEMIERVARALAMASDFVSCNALATREEYADKAWRGYVPNARAAIEAMRKPTQAMAKVADYNASMAHMEVTGSGAGWLYEVMIDSVLAEAVAA